MARAAKKSRFSGKLSGRERAALVFCVAFMLATLVLSYFDRGAVLYSLRNKFEDDDQLRYTGTIVTPAKMPGRCKFVEYDNKRSEFRNTEVGDCLVRRNNYNAFDRMNSLRDAFSR